MTPFKKYIWLANELLRAGERGLSLKEINERWMRNDDLSNGEPIPRKTFDRWKWAIEDMFGLLIENEGKGEYRYGFVNEHALRQGTLNRWLLDTYSALDTLTGNLSLHNRILVDEVPSSQQFLTLLLTAMRSNKVVKLAYCNFKRTKPLTFPVEPYCLKLFQRRWYLLAHSINDDSIRLYALDRTEYVEATDDTFELPPDFDAREYFSDYFGIVADSKVEKVRIVLRAYKEHTHYLRTLPLHHSQRELGTTDTYTDFELHLRPTYDFVMELLRVGALVEVLEPETLRKTMRGWTRDLAELYQQ